MTDVLDRVQVWRPYVDPPVLTTAMAAGPTQVPADELAVLSAYLEALVGARRAPVHVNVAFNAAYFGYDLDSGGYVGGPLDLDAFVRAEHRTRTVALPVGAMVAVATGAEPLYGEVVYREGNHPAVGADAAVPAWLSGAPAGATDPGSGGSSTSDRTGATPGSAAVVVSAEKLVLDFDAFTSGFSATEVQLSRLRRNARWLDPRGHLLLDATYPDGSGTGSAAGSESAQYQRFLLTTAYDQMMSAAAPLPLSTVLAPGAGLEDLAAALAGMFATVAYVLSRLASVRLWGAYTFSRDAFARRLSSAGVLGGEDLALLAGRLESSAAAPRTRRRTAVADTTATAYTAVGPLLELFSGADERLRGVEYAAAVIHANTVVADYARRESDPDTGLLAGNVSLRVDDAWQHGGVWRAHRPGVAEPAFDVAEPLGLGWREATGQAEPDARRPEPQTNAEPEPAPELEPQPEPAAQPEPQPAPEPAPEPEPGPEPELDELDDLDDEGHVLNVTDSQVMWTQTLRLAHLTGSYLPVPAKVTELWHSSVSDGTELWHSSVSDGTELRLALHHAGAELDPEEASQSVTARDGATTWALAGVTWPIDFYPALRLMCTWQRGGRSITATTTLLDFPVTVDGLLIQHRYDAAVITRDNADPDQGPGSWKATPPGGQAEDGAPTWPARVLRVVRQAGLLDPDGRATLPQARAIEITCGPGASGADRTACALAVDDLVTQAKLRRLPAGLDGRRRWVSPPLPGTAEVTVLVYTPTVVVGPARKPNVPRVLTGLIAARGLDPRLLADIEVSQHLRKLQPGQQASQAQRDAYRDQREAFHLSGSSDLPPGYTFVRSFHRGS